MKKNVVKGACALGLMLAAPWVKAQTKGLRTGQDSVRHVQSLRPYDFVFTDTAGREHTLAEYKGKYTYLDMWASWCYPCRKEYPFLEQMAAGLDSSKVKVVSVSIDITRFRWLGALGGYHMKGEQWLVKDTAFERAFEIDRIPRFILLDKEGKVMDYNTSRPSHEETAALLKNLK